MSSQAIRSQELPIRGSDGEALNCEVQHPEDLANVRQLHSLVLPVDKAQRMAEFFSLVGRCQPFAHSIGVGITGTECFLLSFGHLDELPDS